MGVRYKRRTKKGKSIPKVHEFVVKKKGNQRCSQWCCGYNE